MKEMSAKKIVLASIAFLASALLFTGMLFSVIKLDVGFNMELEAGLKIKDVQWFANGYDMLSFELPAVLKSMITQLYAKMNYEADLTALEVISGIFSVLTLVAAVAGCVLTGDFDFLLFEKGEQESGNGGCHCFGFAGAGVYRGIDCVRERGEITAERYLFLGAEGRNGAGGACRI